MLHAKAHNEHIDFLLDMIQQDVFTYPGFVSKEKKVIEDLAWHKIKTALDGMKMPESNETNRSGS